MPTPNVDSRECYTPLETSELSVFLTIFAKSYRKVLFASLPFEVNACYHLVDQDLEGALKALEGEEQVDPREMAIVKYTPSAENPNAQYADEVYYPPVPDEKAAIRDVILSPNAVDST